MKLTSLKTIEKFIFENFSFVYAINKVLVTNYRLTKIIKQFCFDKK